MAMTARGSEPHEGAPTGHVHGTAEQVAGRLAEVAAPTGADELLVPTSTDDRGGPPGLLRPPRRARRTRRLRRGGA
ncbi:hypothetical protein [Streptomyces globosus]